MNRAEQLAMASKELSERLAKLTFPTSITHIYNPLEYAWKPYYKYLLKTGANKKRIIFVGMNPGPWGMAQTGVPFGEITAVTDWLNIREAVLKPENEHPKRLIQGFECKRSEVSGRRLWGLMSDKFKTADVFFRNHWVANYCPLYFISESGRNFTPDKLPKKEQLQVFNLCDEFLFKITQILEPEWLIGVGNFAGKRINIALKKEVEAGLIKTGTILHPSPASPAANRGWSEAVVKRMLEYKLW